MGLATAWRAASSAHVVLLERFGLGHERGASHGGERIFRYAYPDPAYVEMALAADDGWQQLERDAGSQLLQRIGCVDHGADAQVEVLADVAERLGLDVELLDAKVAAKRWPAMRFDTEVLLQPSAGWVRADVAIRCLAEQATRRGADLRFGTRVEDIEVEGDEVRVRTGNDTFVSSAVVITAGAWTTEFVDVPDLKTTEEHVFFFRARPRRRVPAFLHTQDGVIYGLPAANGLVKLGEHHTGDVVTGDERTFVTGPDRVARMERYVAEWFPGLEPEAVDSKTCLYTSTPRHRFVLDRVGPVVVGCGFSGEGFKFVPEIGRRLAALAGAG